MKNKREDLEDCIDPENGLLYKLKDQMIINNREIVTFLNIIPYRSLNMELLRKIEMEIENISREFIEALCKDDQDHIAKFIVTAGCETNSDERLLPRELRKVIDDNMFCLEKLIDTEKLDLIHRLVTEECITSKHRDRVIRCKREEKAYELLVILRRRRYRDYFNFMECLRKTMQNNIVKILENGGVMDVQIEFYQERSDKRDIEAELIRKLTGYVDEDKANELSEEQKKIVDELLAKLAENDIYFIGACTGTSKNSVSMFLQGRKDDSLPVLQEGCESGSLKNTMDKFVRTLFKIPEGSPPLVKMVTTGNHSDRHHVTTATGQNSGEIIICFMFRHLLSSSQFNS